MQLSARILTNVSGVNAFSYATQQQFMKGDAADVYLQLIDVEQHLASQGFSPFGNRYMPAAAATLSVQFLHIDASKRVTRSATQPYSLDPSIWKVVMLASDPLQGTLSLKLTLTEGAVVRTAYLQAVVLVKSFEESC